MKKAFLVNATAIAFCGIMAAMSLSLGNYGLAVGNLLIAAANVSVATILLFRIMEAL